MMTSTPTTFPVKYIRDENNDANTIMFIPIALLLHDNILCPFAIIFNPENETFLFGIMENIAMELAEYAGHVFSRFDVLRIYCAAAASFLVNKDAGKTEQFLMDLANPYVSRMLEDEAQASKSPIQCIKTIAVQTGFSLVHDYLDKLLEEHANKQLAHKKAQVIQQYFRRVISDPYHDMCKRRLMYEFHNMTS